jgi:hypothetical protein
MVADRHLPNTFDESKDLFAFLLAYGVAEDTA